MEIKVQSIHFDADQKLIDYITEKSNKLTKYFDRIINIDVYLRLDSGKQVVKDKVVEIKLVVPGTTLFSKEVSKSFEESADLAIQNVQRQLKKYKEKIRNN